MKPGDIMAFLRSMTVVDWGRGEFGMIKPFASMVKGVATRVPLMHWRQLMNCVAEDILTNTSCTVIAKNALWSYGFQAHMQLLGNGLTWELLGRR